MTCVPRSATIAAFISIAALSLSFFHTNAQGQSRNRTYVSPNRVFSVTVPKAPNWAGVQYRTTALDTKGDRHYDRVMFHVDDFGQYLVAAGRTVPTQTVAAMDVDDHQTVLRNVSQAALMGWRTDLEALPEVAQESFLETKYGEAIVRVYRATKGSFLTQAHGRLPTRDDAFDTNIASIVARDGALVVFVIAQNDASPDDVEAVVRMATELFQDIRVLGAR